MKIAIPTDAWPPQISGVVAILKRTIKEVEQLGHEVRPIHPDCFPIAFPRPTYLKFTTSFTTRFDAYVQLRFGVPSRFIFMVLRWFHSAASNVMIASWPFPVVCTPYNIFMKNPDYSISMTPPGPLVTPR